jgi:hypothetical protein
MKKCFVEIKKDLHLSDKQTINKLYIMGLDVTVYQNIQVLNPTNKEIEDMDYDFIAFVIDDAFKPRIKNLIEDAFYSGDNVYDDISYAYSYHSRFRNMLGILIGLKNSEWTDGEKLKPEMDFFELLWFADNEGCIDWETSEKLYNDFKRNQEKANELFGYDEDFIFNYERWTKAFYLGKEKGVIKFH